MPLLYNILFVNHTMISAMMLITGMVLFVLSLEKGCYKYQFKRLGWQIICIMVSISPGFFFSYYVWRSLLLRDDDDDKFRVLAPFVRCSLSSPNM